MARKDYIVGRRGEVAANSVSNTQPSSRPGSHSDRTSLFSNTSMLDYVGLEQERHSLRPIPLFERVFLSKCLGF